MHIEQNFQITGKSISRHQAPLSSTHKAFGRIMQTAKTSFIARYIAATERKATDEHLDDADFEFTSRLMETTATLKNLLTRRLGAASAQQFVDGIDAWHAAIKSGISDSAMIRAQEFPRRLATPHGPLVLETMKELFASIEHNRHPAFRVEHKPEPLRVAQASPHYGTVNCILN